MGMLLLCCSSLVLLTHARSAAIGITVAGLLVFCLSSEADVAPYLIARYCGLKNFSTLYGLSWTFCAFGAAIGPVVTGRTFDHAGGYESGFITLLSLPYFAGALLTLLLPNYATAASTGAVLDSMLPSLSHDGFVPQFRNTKKEG